MLVYLSMTVSNLNILTLDESGQGYAFLIKGRDSYTICVRKCSQTYKVNLLKVDLLGRKTFLNLEDLEQARRALFDVANRVNSVPGKTHLPTQVFLSLNVLSIFEKDYNKYFVFKLTNCGEYEVLSEEIPTFEEAVNELNIISKGLRCKIIPSLLTKWMKMEVLYPPNLRDL